MASAFDEHFHTFKCPGPQCGQVFDETYRRLVKPNEVACPKCGTTIDIRKSKVTGEIGKWFDTCQQIDLTREREEKK
jgi:transcription elongation factor Elf1